MFSFHFRVYYLYSLFPAFIVIDSNGFLPYHYFLFLQLLFSSFSKITCPRCSSRQNIFPLTLAMFPLLFPFIFIVHFSWSLKYPCNAFYNILPRTLRNLYCSFWSFIYCNQLFVWLLLFLCYTFFIFIFFLNLPVLAAAPDKLPVPNRLHVKHFYRFL